MSATMTASRPDATIVEAYGKDGFVFPLDIMDAGQAQALRADLEAAEAELSDEPEKLALLRAYPDRVLPSFDKMIRHPKIIEAARRVLGHIDLTDERIGPTIDRPGPCAGRDIGAGSARRPGIDQRQRGIRIMFH